ncbi:MAG: hypothetical protein JRG92_20250, partial [Deltaproteobacteria bacterium]|nr:hypothetical protein [Deltaproteobacteria bacterium]
MARQTRSPRQLLAWGTFGLLSLTAMAFDGAYIANMTQWFSTPFRGWIYSVAGDPHIVIETYEVAERAGLEVDDRIRTINGGRFETFREMHELLKLELGETNIYAIERGELVLEVPTVEMGILNTLHAVGGSLVGGLVFIAAGILVFLMKPRDGATWSFLLFTLIVGVAFPYMWLGPSFEPGWLEGVFVPATYLSTAAVLQLAAFFPRRRRFVADRWPLVALPYGIAVVLSVMELSSGDYRTPSTLAALRMCMLAGSLIVFLASALETWLRSQSSAARIQAITILTGGVLSGFVPTVDNLYTSIVGVRLAPIAILPAFLFGFPISIGYAIVQHDLFEIDTIIRRTYGYLLTTAVVITLYGATVSGLNFTIGPTDIMSSP